MNQTELFKNTIEHFGKEPQIDMMIEECSELIQALCKHKRGLPSNVEEELADVNIMLEQMRLLFNSEVIANYHLSKVLRLEKTLKENQK